MDALFRLAYRVAFRLLRLWWRVRRPTCEGAAVAVWQGGRLLVARTSYHGRLDLPGGGLVPGEAPRAGALRELLEEVGVEAPAEGLAFVGSFRFEDLGRRITDHVFAWRPATAPDLRIDRREIVWAGWLEPEAIRGRPMTPTLRLYLASLEGGPPPGAAQAPKGTCQIARA